MKKNLFIIVIFIGLFAAGLGITRSLPVAEAQTVKTVNYGLNIFLSGAAAPWGIPVYRSLFLDVLKINERGGFKVGNTTHKWELVTCDSKYVPAEAVKCANKLIYDDKVPFMTVGGGSCAIACIPLLKEANILSVSMAAGGKTLTNPDNPLFFRYLPAIEGMYSGLFPWMIKNEGIKTIASINPDDETGRSGKNGSQFIADINNLKVVSAEFFERGIKEFGPVLTRVIAKNPDMIETGFTDPTSSALILKQARELGYKGKIVLAWGPDAQQAIKMAGKHAEGAYMILFGPPEPRNPAQKNFYNQFIQKWPAKEFDASLWTNTELISCVTKAIEETQSFDTKKIATHLETMTWESPMGTLRFGGSKLYGIKRQLLYPVTLVVAKEGAPVYIDTLQIPPGILD